MKALQLNNLNNFINLKDYKFFDTQIMFQKNESEVLNNGEIKSRQQKLNLMMVDSKMPELIIDLAKGIFNNQYNGFKEFVDSNSLKPSQVINMNNFMKRKISDLLEYLLFAELEKDSVLNGNLNNDNIYCFKNTQSELVFFTIYEKRELFDFVINRNVISTNILSEDKESLLLEMKFKIKL